MSNFIVTVLHFNNRGELTGCMSQTHLEFQERIGYVPQGYTVDVILFKEGMEYQRYTLCNEPFREFDGT